MTTDMYTFFSPSAGDWVTKCARCGAWWLAGSGVDALHSHGPRMVSMCADCGTVEDATGDCAVCREGAGVDA